MDFESFPHRHPNEHEARMDALDLSDKDRDRFYYVVFNKSSGLYLVDLVALPASDEMLLGTYYQAKLIN
jgi:hypothetical protein